MKHLCYLLLPVLLCSAAGRLAAQAPADPVSGVWTGNFTNTFFLIKPRQIVVELFLHNDSLLTGASHLYYSGNKYEHYTLSGIYRKKDATVYFREDSTLGVNLGFLATNCLGNYNMKLDAAGEKLQLKGIWRDNNPDGPNGCPSVNVLLEKPMKAKKAPLATPSQAPPVEDKNLKRAADIQSLIEIGKGEMDSVKVELYDNKKIDGDVISLYVNDSVVLHKQALTAEPLVLYVSLKPGAHTTKIKMAAESMGSDPPCTALMRVTTRSGRRYEVNLSSTYDRNSIIELFLKD